MRSEEFLTTTAAPAPETQSCLRGVRRDHIHRASFSGWQQTHHLIKLMQSSVMKLPPDVEFHEDIPLLIYRPRGVLNEQSVDKIVSIIGDLEAKLREPFNRFFDTRGHDEVELNFRYVIQISLHRVLSYGDRPPVKSAILATDTTIIHYCQLHAIITEDSPIRVRIFQQREEAAKWLGVPTGRVVVKFAAR